MNKLDVSVQETSMSSSTSSLGPVFPDDLLDYCDHDPIVLDLNENSQSRCSSQETIDENFVSQVPETQNSEDLNREPNCDNIESEELTQEPRKRIVPLTQVSPQLLSSSSTSSTRNNSEDIMQIVDDYWTMKYRQLMTSS